MMFLQALAFRLDSRPILSFILETLKYRNNIEATIDLRVGQIELVHQTTGKEARFFVDINDVDAAMQQFNFFFEEVRKQ